VLQQPEEAWFDVNMMQKDMVLAMELGRKLNVPVPTTALTNEFLTPLAAWMGEARLRSRVRRAGSHGRSSKMTTTAQPTEFPNK